MRGCRLWAVVGVRPGQTRTSRRVSDWRLCAAVHNITTPLYSEGADPDAAKCTLISKQQVSRLSRYYTLRCLNFTKQDLVD